jgi:hypothetical protein
VRAPEAPPSPTESPEASPNPISKAAEASSLLLGSKGLAIDAQQVRSANAVTIDLLQHGPEAKAGTNAESKAADLNMVLGAQAGTDAKPKIADLNTAYTPLYCGSANPLYEVVKHASPWYTRTATGLNYAMTPGRASSEGLTRLS